MIEEEAWKLFSQTGNIEAYLLLKELENDQTENTSAQNIFEDKDPSEEV